MNESRISVLSCPNCRSWLVIDYRDQKFYQKGINVLVYECPFLVCKKCGFEKLVDIASRTIEHRLNKALSEGAKQIEIQGPPKRLRFDYSEDIPFEYDGRDWWAIPGLHRPWDEGFLTPVFFRRKVLTKYMTQPGYFLGMSSATGGAIGFHERWSIRFGINQRNEVVMWLGYIARLPEEERYYLRSENIPSSHDVGSDFFTASIEVIAPSPSPELKILEARDRFYKSVFQKWEVSISHFDNEAIDSMENIVRPPVWTEEIVRTVIDALNKVCIETLDSSNIKSHLITENKAKADDLKDLRSLKLFNLWIKIFLRVANSEEILRPLFILYDLRVLLLHLFPKEKRREEIKSIANRLSIDKDNLDLESIYAELIDRLAKMWEKLCEFADQWKDFS